MKRLYFIKKGKLEWREVTRPKISDKQQAIVRPFAVAKCDLDDAFLFNNLAFKLKIGSWANAENAFLTETTKVIVKRERIA